MKPSALLCVLFVLVLPHVSSLELTEELLEHMRAQGVFPASAQKAAELTDEQYAQLNRDLDAVEKTCAGAPQSWNLIDLRARIITNAVEQPDSANSDDKVPQQMPELVLSVRQFNPNVVLPPREEDDGGDERPLSFPGLQEEPSVPPPRQAQRVDDGAEASFIEAGTSSKLRAKAGESITSEQAGKCEADALAVLAKAGIDSETIIVERPLRTVDESGMIPRFVSMLETEAARVWRKYDVLHGGIMSGGAESYKAGGTLGAILVPEDLASATPNELKAKVQSLGDKPIFYTLTNQHVYSNADGSPIVQPARRYMEDSYTGANNVCPNAKAEPTPAACQRPIGKKLLSVQNQNDKSKLDQSGKPADSKHKPLMDAAVGAIDRAHHVECKMHGLGGDIKGIDPRGSHNLDPRLAGSSQQGYGIKVTKSGARTGVTTGYVIAVNDGDGPAAFQIVSRSLPKMEGMKDYTVVDRRPFETDWANSYKAEEKEPDYLEAYLCREVATAWGEEFDRLSEERKLRVRTRVANLLHHKLVTAFSMAGDSGSVVLTRNKAMAVFNNGWNVFGLMNSGRSAPYFFDAKYNPDSDDPKLRKPPGRAVWDHVIKRYWRAFPKITWAVSIESVVWAINKELKKRGSSVRLTVCTTARGKMINAALKSLNKNQDQNALNPQ